MTKYYKIAGLTVAMDTIGQAVSQAEPYLCDQPDQPDIIIDDSWDYIKKLNSALCDEDCAYLASGASFYQQLLNFQGMMLHSSAVVMDGYAYLFSAPCGTGKSTHTTLWQTVFGADRARILNDDKPALRLEDGTFYAYGTPWSGKTAQNINLRVPLGGICILRRGETNVIEPYGGAAALHDLMEQTIRPRDPAMMGKLLALLDELFAKVPVWKLHCNMDPEAAHVSYEAMSAGRKE